MESASNPRIVRSAHRQGYFPDFTTQASNHSDVVLKDSSELEGFLASSATAEYSSSPLMADYRAALAKYVPGGIRASFGALTWAGGKMLEKVAARFPSGAVTSNDFLEGLYSLRGETAGGLLPPIAFARDQGHAATNHCIVPVRLTKGQWVAPKGSDNFVCDPEWKPVMS